MSSCSKMWVILMGWSISRDEIRQRWLLQFYQPQTIAKCHSISLNHAFHVADVPFFKLKTAHCELSDKSHCCPEVTWDHWLFMLAASQMGQSLDNPHSTKKIDLSTFLINLNRKKKKRKKKVFLFSAINSLLQSSYCSSKIGFFDWIREFLKSNNW